MPPGALTVQDDGTLTVVPRPDEDTAAFEATLARFTELVCPTAGQRVYRLTAAAIWRARRAGLTLEEVLQTLETSSTTALPPQVRADLERWSRQIDRLTLEADQGRLLLRTTHPLVLTAVQRHRTLGTFITHQLDATTVALRPDAYPELVQTFDACGYPVLDRVPAGWQPEAAPVLPAATPARPVVQPLPVPTGRRRAARVEGLRRLPRQCQATTQAGRRCKNRVQPGSQVLPGACAVVPAGAVPGHVHPAGPPGQPGPGRQAGTWAGAAATAGGVPCHRPHGHRAPHLAAVAPPDVARWERALPGAPALGGRGAGVGGHVWTRGASGGTAGADGKSADGPAPRDLGRPRLPAQRRADPPPVFCGDPRDPPRGSTLPLGAVVGMGICVLPRGGRPRAPLLHLPRRDVRLILCLPWAKERGGWGVALGPERSRAMAGLERSVKRSVPIF